MLPISFSGSSSATSGANAGPIDTIQSSAFNYARGAGDASQVQSRGAGGFALTPQVAALAGVAVVAAVGLAVMWKRK